MLPVRQSREVLLLHVTTQAPLLGLVCAAASSCAYSSSLTLKPMDFVRSGGFTMIWLPFGD